jgi:hypothetical protein
MTTQPFSPQTTPLPTTARPLGLEADVAAACCDDDCCDPGCCGGTCCGGFTGVTSVSGNTEIATSSWACC